MANLDDLDSLLADLGGTAAPPPASKPAPQPASATDLDSLMADLGGGGGGNRGVSTASIQTNDLDALMADLGGATGAPAATAAPGIQRGPGRATRASNDLDALMNDLSGTRTTAAPAAKPAPAAQPAATSTGGASDLDSLMAELSGPSPQTASVTPAAAAPAPTSTGGGGGMSDLDYLMADLSGGAAPAAAAAPAPASSGATDLDALMADLTPGPNGFAPAAQRPAATGPARTNPNMIGANDLDSVMAALSGGSQPAPAASTGGGANLDNILQNLTSDMDRMGVSNEYKGTCAGCMKPIIGQVVTAIGKSWHPECFACHQCRVPLGTASFFERDGHPYCETHYHELFSPRCAYCNGVVLDRCITALGRTWHPRCFFCAHCGKSFEGGGFMEKDGKPYCEADYFAMFAPKCGKCDQAIMGDCVTAMGKQWHPECFVCTGCNEGFSGGSFFEVDGMPYCEKDFHAQQGSLCTGCQKPITGRCVTAMGSRYHPECFICAFCMKQLSRGTFKEHQSKAYCTACHVKLYG